MTTDPNKSSVNHVAFSFALKENANYISQSDVRAPDIDSKAQAEIISVIKYN